MYGTISHIMTVSYTYSTFDRTAPTSLYMHFQRSLFSAHYGLSYVPCSHSRPLRPSTAHFRSEAEREEALTPYFCTRLRSISLSTPSAPAMAGGEEAFAHSLCRIACLQVIYAQAERRTTAAKKPASSPVKAPARSSQRPPVSPDAVHIVDSAADTLADVLAAFLHQVACSTIARTRLSGRTICSLADVISALQAVAPATQSSLRDVARYATHQPITFPQRVPDFPVLPTPLPSLPQPPSPTVTTHVLPRKRSYIEPWMPQLPPAHTYVTTPGVLSDADLPRAAPPPSHRRRVEASLAQLRGVDSAPEPVRTIVPGNPYFAPPVLEEMAASSSRAVRDDGPAESAPPFIENSKPVMSDQKRARVERILAESGGTIGVPPGAPSTPANATPGPATPGPNTPAPDGGSVGGDGA